MKEIKIQHGDVILEEVKSIPEEAKKVSLKQCGRGLIIERGEGTCRRRGAQRGSKPQSF